MLKTFPPDADPVYFTTSDSTSHNYDLNVMNGHRTIESYDADAGVYTILFDEGETQVEREI